MSDPGTSRSDSRPPGQWEPPSLEMMQGLLSQYEFICLLGRGGMGAVYKARQVSLDRLVAIKVLPGDLLDDAETNFMERFKQEARTMARMNHPAIVSVYDFGQTHDGLLYFVMEFINGTDVAQMILSQRRLAPDHALAITAHVCDALAYAHGHGVIHRDIKPANVLINMEGQVKVADFGLAKANDGADSGLTKSNVAMGTPDFVAPEALMPGVPLDGRADLYAVGVMLYQMLTGDIPRGLWQMPSLKVGADNRFDAIIAKAMQTDREMRYQSSQEIRQDLDRILTMPMVQAGGQSSAAIPKQAVAAQKPVARFPQPRQKEATPPQAPPRRKSGVGLPLGLGAAACAIAAAAFFATREPADEEAPPAKPEIAAAPKPAAPPPSPPSVPQGAKDQPPPPFSQRPPALEARTVDLLPRLDLDKDLVAGQWRRQEEHLVFVRDSGSAKSLLELPVAPPASYRVEAIVVPQKLAGEIVLHLPLLGQSKYVRDVTLRLRLGNNERGGFEYIEQKGIDAVGFGNSAPVSFKAGQPNKVLVEVAPGSDDATLKLWVNDEPVIAWKGSRERMTGAAGLWRPRRKESLAVGTTSEALVIRRVRLDPRGGEVKWLRPEPVIAAAPSSPAPTPLPPAPLSAPAPAAPAAPDPVGIRLRDIEKQFHDAYEKQVGAAHKSAVADLNQKYVSALDRAISAASAASNLDEALALRGEKELILTQAAIPQEDAADVVLVLKSFRETYRRSHAGLVANREQLAAPLYAAYDRALGNYQDELTRNSLLDEAQRVKAVRDHVNAQADTPSRAAAALGAVPPARTVAEASSKGVPAAPPLAADQVLPPLPRANAEEVRELVTWCLEVKKGNVRVLEDGKRIYVTSVDQLPKGRLSVITFYVYGMDTRGEDKKWFSIMTRMPELEEISFSKNPGTFPMEELRGMTGLKVLRLAPEAVDDAAFAHLTNLKQLEKLTVTYWCKKFNGTGLGYINDNLLELETDSKTLSPEGLAFLPRFKKLKRLLLPNCTSLADSMLQQLADLPALEDLNVSQTHLDGSFLTHLPENSNLKRLWLEDMKNFKAEHLPLLARLKNLEHVSLPPLDIKPEEMAAIASLPKLATINVDFNSAFTGEGFAGVKGFGALKSLQLNRSGITDAGWQAMGESLTGLQSLSFSRYANEKSAVTAAAFGTHMSKLRDLTTLLALHDGITDEWVSQIARLKKLTNLSLQGAGITDAGLVPLQELPLASLRIDQTAVTDACIPVLKKFPKLRSVNIGSTKMTPQGMEEVKRSLKQ